MLFSEYHIFKRKIVACALGKWCNCMKLPVLRTERRPRRFPLWLACALGVTAAGTGCRHADLAERRLALRSSRVERTASAVVHQEQKRGPALKRTVNIIRQSEQRHAEAARANLDEIDAYWQRDCQRWIERQPIYRDEARQILWGKPDRIEGNAIILFF